MLRRILSYGLIAGLLVGVPLSVMTVGLNGHPPLRYGMVLGYTMMLIALSTVFVAIKRHRDRDLGGVIRFWPAFGLGVGISVVAGICYVAAWETAVAIAHMDFRRATRRKSSRSSGRKASPVRLSPRSSPRWSGSRSSTPIRSFGCRWCSRRSSRSDCSCRWSPRGCCAIAAFSRRGQ